MSKTVLTDHPLFQSVLNQLKNNCRKIIWSPEPPDIDSAASCALLEAASPNLFGGGTPIRAYEVPATGENPLALFLPKIDTKISRGIPFKKPLTFVIPDYGNFRTCKINAKIFPVPDFFIGFDHHDQPASDFPENGIQIVDPEAASTTVVIYEFLRWAGIEITEKMALYTALGIYADTARLTNPKTNYQALRIFKECLDTGISFEEIRRAAEPTMTLERLKVWGEIFLEIPNGIDHELHLATLVINKKQKNRWGDKNAITVMDKMQQLRNIYTVIILRENNDGSWKISIRSQPYIVSAARLARLLGGGGHPHMAATGSWSGNPQEALEIIRGELKKIQKK